MSQAHERSEGATRPEHASEAAREGASGGVRGAKPLGVIFDEVSKFYGEVLGVNRVTLNIPPGITSLVGPNGAGKTTLMNLMTGLIHPDNGQILVRGISPRDPATLMRITGYATQYDTAPRWATGSPAPRGTVSRSSSTAWRAVRRPRRDASSVTAGSCP